MGNVFTTSSKQLLKLCEAAKEFIMSLPGFLRHLTRIMALALLMPVTCMCSPVRPQTTQTEENMIESEGLRRTYELYVPTSYDGAPALPLVIALHGRGGTGQGMSDLTSLSQISELEGFIVVYPNGYENSWADGRGETPADEAAINDVRFISSLIDRLSSDYKVIVQQVYVTGFSNGGYLTHRLACELPEKIAAVAPVGATLSENVYASCEPKGSVPVLQINVTEDTFVPYLGGEVNGGGLALSAEVSVAFWANANGCLAEPSNTNLTDTVQDGTTVTISSYKGCQQNADVQLYTVIGGGHTWPGGLQYLPERRIGKTSRDMDASEIIWTFFKKHPKLTH
jgi:polyhydroxybutyrate depolymerase